MINNGRLVADSMDKRYRDAELHKPLTANFCEEEEGYNLKEN